MVFILIVVLVVILYFSFLYNRRQSIYHKFAKQIGGPQGRPLIGNALEFMRNFDRILQTLSNRVDQFGDRFVFFFGPSPVFLINNAEDLEKVCTSTELIVKSEEYDMLKDWLGLGLLNSTGQFWAQRRKLLTPCFHFAILERFIGSIDTQAKILVEVLKENFEDKSDFNDVTLFVQRCALDIICETSMGIQLNSQRDENCEYVKCVHRMGQLFMYRMIRPWLRINALWKLTASGREEAGLIKKIHSFTDKVIADRKKLMIWKILKKVINNCDSEENNLEESGNEKKALLDMLLETQQKDPLSMSDEGIRDETNTFIFAGHDTVSVTTSFCLYNIGNHPRVQAKLHQEMDSIFGDDPDRPVTSADLKKMKYLELCIKESLRIIPSVPIIARHVHKPFQLDEDTIVPEGVALYICTYKLHRNPKYFQKPDEFIPERFDMESEEYYSRTVKSPFVYLPFSAGARNCIGQKMAMMEVKIMLANILRNFKLTSEKKLEELEILSELVMRVKGGLKMKFERR